MFPKFLRPLKNNHGVGLITAIFIIVIVGMFGLLVSRYVMTHSVSSAEDILWAEALYAAESAVQLRLLQEDNIGMIGVTTPMIQGYSFTYTQTIINPLAPSPPFPRVLNVLATQGRVSREVEVSYTLTID